MGGAWREVRPIGEFHLRPRVADADGVAAEQEVSREPLALLDDAVEREPDQKKEPLENASHVRNAISRFNQVKDVSDDDRDAAWKRIKTAAKKFDVEVSETSWREIGK